MDAATTQLALGLGVGFGLGLLCGYALFRNADSKLLQSEKSKVESQLAEATSQLQGARIKEAQAASDRDHARAQHENLKESWKELQQKLDSANAMIFELKPKHEAASKEVELVRSQLAQSQQLLLDLDKALSDRFSTLATKVIEDQSKKFQDFGSQNLGGLINPLRERIAAFEKQVNEAYDQESKQRHLLQHRLQDMITAQARLSEEAHRLTTALRADHKTQGNWGEVVLKGILDRSGLREGHEYETQGRGLSLVNDEGNAQRPDCIVRLGDNKHLIIDSKVTLRSFERFVHAQSEAERDEQWKAFELAIGEHVNGLSEKHYHTQAKLGSPEYVMMFMPTEASYALLLERSPQLVEDAWAKRIIPVGPTNLMACLKAVDTVWKFNRQNKNVEQVREIGRRALDKFAEFTKDIVSVGERLQSAEKALSDASTKLQGKGGLISLMKRMTELDVPNTKAMASKLADGVDPADETEAS